MTRIGITSDSCLHDMALTAARPFLTFRYYRILLLRLVHLRTTPGFVRQNTSGDTRRSMCHTLQWQVYEFQPVLAYGVSEAMHLRLRRGYTTPIYQTLLPLWVAVTAAVAGCHGTLVVTARSSCRRYAILCIP